MKQYTVVNRPLFLKGGVLELNEAQAKTREHRLRHIRGRCFEVTGEVCFKIGEVIGLDGAMSKAERVFLEQVSAETKGKKEAPTKKSKKSKGVLYKDFGGPPE